MIRPDGTYEGPGAEMPNGGVADAGPMTHLSLFSGIGGIDLAAEWAGFKTIAFVEKDPFCQAVLRKHWPEVPIHGDVREFRWPMADAERGRRGAQRLARSMGEVQAGEPHAELSASQPGPRRVSLVSGGFPCQPFSVAGKRKGAGDERFLWYEMLRVIREVRPIWVLGENVRGLLSIDGGRTFGTIVHELAEVGYRVGWGVYGACHVGAPHRRERVFIVGHRADADRARRREQRRTIPAQAEHAAIEHGSEAVAHAEQQRLQAGRDGGGHGISTTQSADDNAAPPKRGDGAPRDWWRVEPAVGRVANGVPDRVDRLRSLGNAVVPQQVFPILEAIADELRGEAERVGPKQRDLATSGESRGAEGGEKDAGARVEGG